MTCWSLKIQYNQVVYQTENLGEVLRGDRIVNTKYDVHVDKSESCAVLCKQELNAEYIAAFKPGLL